MVVISFWHVFKPCVEDFFLLVHVSVLFCILRERARGGAQFSTTFYTLYILQSFFDILLVLTYGTYISLANFGVSIPFANVALALGTYGHLGQGVAHALISYNRYTAIVHPLENTKIWTTRRTALACIIALLLPVPALIVKFQVHYTLEINKATGGYNLAYTSGIYANINAFFIFGYCVVNAVASAYMEITTFNFYYKLNKASKLAYRDDYKLLGVQRACQAKPSRRS
ncbi:hypothetical protein AAVH_08236 [Aphelenchoides avenae]|nr:hypothetical protein AAVH_08236 [Aphelenchus avenae]